MANTTTFREKLIETFKAFDRFCKDKGIRYFAAYGTLIGAVRHQGLIPWDDDIDVWMLPEDYEKFMSYKGKVEDHYDIINDNDENYWLFSLIKFVDTNTTLWEAEEFPCITGVYIDIFPLMECDEKNAKANRAEYDAVSYKLTQSMKRRSLGHIIRLYLTGHAHEGKSLYKEWAYSTFNYISNRRQYNELAKRLKSQKGNYYVSYDGAYHEKEVFPKEWFEDTVSLIFEKTEIPAPKAYDEVLRKLYGDYMQLPPEDKRVSHHSHYFEDLNRRIGIKEIKRILKNR